MSVRDRIAFSILLHWGYRRLEVGDLDGRNFEASQKEHSKKSWYRPKDRSYKTIQAIAHAYRLADISIKCMRR